MIIAACCSVFQCLPVPDRLGRAATNGEPLRAHRKKVTNQFIVFGDPGSWLYTEKSNHVKKKVIVSLLLKSHRLTLDELSRDKRSLLSKKPSQQVLSMPVQILWGLTGRDARKEENR